MVCSTLRSLAEHSILHGILEVSVVGLLDLIVANTVLSLVAGIIIVEGSQALLRHWRSQSPTRSSSISEVGVLCPRRRPIFLPPTIKTKDVKL